MTHEPPSALRALFIGLCAAAAVFGGLALIGVSLAWSGELSPSVHLISMILGGLLLTASIAYAASAQPETDRRLAVDGPF